MPDPDKDLLVRQVLAERAKLLALIRSIVGRQDLAEDIFQDLCLLIIAKRDEVVEANHASAWLRTAGRHLAMNAKRKAASQALLLGDRIHELLDRDWRELDGTSGLALGDALERCVARLKPAEKQVIFGRYTDGLDYGALSSQLGRSVTALYKTMGRIQKKLAQCIHRRVTSQERGHV